MINTTTTTNSTTSSSPLKKRPSSSRKPKTPAITPTPNANVTTPTTTTTTRYSKKIKLPPPSFADLKLPTVVSPFVPESLVYTKLAEFEKKLDTAISKKQLDIGEATRTRSVKVTRNVNIRIYNTYSQQTPFYHISTKSQQSVLEPSSWTLRIEGRVSDDQPSASSSSKSNQKDKNKRKFSSFLKKMFIQIGAGGNDVIEWDRSQSSGETDGFEVKRKGTEEVEVKILLYIDYSPPRVKLSPQLGSLLGLKTETRPRTINAIWQYIKINHLIDPNDRQLIRCDAPLKDLFGVDTVQLTQLPQSLREHMSPIDPIEIVYKVNLSRDPREFEQEYDISIEMEEVQAALQGPHSSSKRTLNECEDSITVLLQELQEHKRKRDFMQSFVKNPVQFLYNMVDSQLRDYKTLKSGGDRGKDPEERRKSEYFFQPYITDAAKDYLSKHATPPATPLVALPTTPTQ
eukprot:TRINITY_DN8229_c0_g1_i4.p1 TRINITY_DN8229_c0_g1~~TRINITY_DN8229_c0_g1_i4.p1  ORF type:complete len:458 (-),score=96.95 TRINITY_DN8229_c0_g1_i4:259-1632(-)